MTNCAYCEKETETYWELWFCDKNPEGIVTNPEPHGNIVGGMPTCEDDYCNPGTCLIPNEDVGAIIKTHEVHERCKECDCIID
jgi:hypothetical protein